MWEDEKADVTDLVLLIQSLYSYVRLMPLHAVIADGRVTKSELKYWYESLDLTWRGPFRLMDDVNSIATADGFALSPLTPTSTSSPTSPFSDHSYDSTENETETTSGSAGFDKRAKLKVYKFRSANNSVGKLNLSVVYDSNLGNIFGQSPSSLSPKTSPVKGGEVGTMDL